MLIYNVTSKVNWNVQQEWLDWMINIHVPEVIATGLFSKHQLVRLQEVDDIDGPTFAVQYYLDSKENYEQYITRFAPVLRAKAVAEWGDNVISFRTLMEVIN
ncbi:MAG: DUF4286 family protein [Chitinophagaceae bacterium]|nr:MAG: DUF4286 family protein [Chitinophagaceae bacterium]